MKKITSVIIMYLLVLTLSSTSFAHEEQNVSGQVLTEETPMSVINYAKAEISDSLATQLGATHEDYSHHSYTLGQPMNTQETGNTNRLYYFPVMRDGEIFATFIIIDDHGDYTSQLEEGMMAEQLQKMNDRDELEDVMLISNEDGFFAVNDTKIVPLDPSSKADKKETPENLINSSETSTDKDELISKDITDSLYDIPLNKTIMNENALISTEKSAYLTLSNKTSGTKNLNVQDSRLSLLANKAVNTAQKKEITMLNVKPVAQTVDGKFTSPQKNWCGEAITAAIINYKRKTSLTARDIVLKVYECEKNKGLTNNQVISIGNQYGFQLKLGKPLPFQNIKKEINNSRPIYMQMKRIDENGKKYYHAISLIGYNAAKSRYTIINPWQQKTTTIERRNVASDITLSNKNEIYKWHKSIYNWK